MFNETFQFQMSNKPLKFDYREGWYWCKY